DAGKAVFDGSVDLAVTTIIVVLTVRTASIVRVGAAGHAELVRVVATHVLHGDAVFQRLAAKTAVNVIHSADIRRKTQQIAIKLITSELVVGRQQRMGFRLSIDLLDFDQSLIAFARGRPGGVNRTS